MSSFKQISAVGAKGLISDRNAVLVDIRDAGSFSVSHAETARHLTNDTIVSLMEEVEFDHPILVMCYHGVSSQGAAEYLVNQGYEEVYSVDGGFSAWHMAGLPTQRG
ncbi:thiosulfate sulfurtransferase GlpE [Vibrio algarum]|uniref:Thiosulfate sulfurtransferase GlpE n=1 Tax=Vibrio algarum TaxID=3020714 RepID=A0ABT4YNF4_9VIBR|nr:thiosulfate sulfurtransferase GlpE [Vibrio sp. KJ40-1]MDB1122683.1 thiosulfate sulfurtransferase GlpE [Vibrio sp. KJ40-1]